MHKYKFKNISDYKQSAHMSLTCTITTNTCTLQLMHNNAMCNNVANVPMSMQCA